MLSIHTKIHDKFSLEFKIAYRVHKSQETSSFLMNTWMFVPNSLDINRKTYKREDFYRDLHTHVRLITPVFLFREIVNGTAVPLKNLEAAMRTMASSPTHESIYDYEHQIKMFSAIFKSSIREQLNYIINKVNEKEKEAQVTDFLIELQKILSSFRQLVEIIKVPTVKTQEINYFYFGDEFLTNLTEKELFGLLDAFSKMNYAISPELMSLVLQVLDYEKNHKAENNYLCVNPVSENKNSDLIFRLGALKKYIESDLFLNAHKKRDGVVAEQVYYSIAAGLSMVFATAVAFSFQLKYGNFTMPFFVALVVSYMLKDRIKELSRFYFAHKFSSKYYDNKTSFSIKDNEIGISKEGFDFIDDVKVPKDIIRVRNRIPLVEAENRYSKERVILFRKIVSLNPNVLSSSTNYDIDGVVEIVRFNLLSFIRKTDNPEVPLFVLNDINQVTKIMGLKNYYINIVLHYLVDGEDVYRRFRVGFNREGINSIVEMKRN